MKLGEVVNHRKGFITIDDELEYKLCRVQLHTRGVVLRSIIKGSKIYTKKQQVCKSGDLIVAEMDAKVGGYGFIPDELDGAIVSSHYYLFELDYSKIKPKFLEVLFKLGLIQNQIKAVGSTNYAAIRPADVLDWKIPDISYENQEKIEKSYNLISDFTTKTNYTIGCRLNHLDKLRLSLLKEAMQGKLVPQDPNDESASELLNRIKEEKARLIKEKKLKPGKPLPHIQPEEIPYPLPPNWVWCRLGDVCDTIGGFAFQSSQYVQNGVRVVRISDFDENGLKNGNVVRYKYSDNLNQYTLDTNSILMAMTGGTVGKCFLVRHITEMMVVNQRVAVIKVVGDLLIEYIHYLLRSNTIQDSIYNLKNSTNDNISMIDIRSFFVPLPPLKEQKRIVDKLNSLMHLCDELKTSIEHSQDLNDRLLKATLREALNGNL